MKRKYVRPIVLVAVILAWLLIPHYLTGIPGYVALGVLSVFSVVFFYKTRMWQSDRTVSARTAKRLSNICLGLTMCLIPISYLTILVSTLAGFDVSKVVSVLLSSVFVLEWYIYTVVCRSTENVRRIEVSLSVTSITIGICMVFLILGQGKGLRPFLRLVAIIACFAVCLIPYITYQVPMKNFVFEVGWFGCVIAAAIITIVLNMQLCSNQYTVETYYVDSGGRTGMTCILSDDYAFNYYRCPTPIGETGSIYQYEGWFHIKFLSESAT